MSISTGIIIFLVGLILGVILGAFTFWKIKQKNIETRDSQIDELKAAFGNLSKEALEQNLDTFFKLTENKFGELVKTADGQLDEKKKLIDSTLDDMKKNLEGLTRSTADLKGQMEASTRGINDLTDTTSQLRQILSSSQARGQWGERMVEDILNFIGLVEGTSYSKQTQAGPGRPDFTFYLPDKKHINMDVKFPLSHYEKYLSSENESEQESEKKAFLADVRNHVKEISKRSYINTSDGTVDYVLMFIPNESIYSFLNQMDHTLIDFSLEKKILLCSPITLYAILSLIRQAVSNFSIEMKAGEMQSQVSIFQTQWGKFVEKLEAFGKSLGTVQNHYEDLSGTRRRQLEKPMEKIKELQLGQDKSQKELSQ